MVAALDARGRGRAVAINAERHTEQQHVPHKREVGCIVSKSNPIVKPLRQDVALQGSPCEIAHEFGPMQPPRQHANGGRSQRRVVDTDARATAPLRESHCAGATSWHLTGRETVPFVIAASLPASVFASASASAAATTAAATTAAPAA